MNTIDLGGLPRYGANCGNQIDYHLTKLGDKIFVLEECKNLSEGLSNREHLHEQEGMLFNLHNTSNIASFHMKDCLMPLDILFVKNGLVEKIYHNCPPCKETNCKKYECDSADTVVELLGGTCKKLDISEGLECKIL